MAKKEITFEEISGTVLKDKATGGNCYTAYLKFKEYIKLMENIYEDNNEFQRKVINVKKSKVYKKLVKDLIKGVVIPTISIYLSEDLKIRDNKTNIDSEDVKILDGLQRTNCIILAYQILNRTENLEGVEDIKDPLNLNSFLEQKVRVEIWTDLTVNGILYKMISLNAGQTPMTVEHQFEIIELPLKKELGNEGIILSTGGERGFPLYLVVEGSIAYNFGTISPEKQSMAISFLDQLDVYKEKHESLILNSERFMEDLKWVLKEFLEKFKEIYSKEGVQEFQKILEQEAFFIPFMAALGKTRRDSGERIDEKKKDLINLLEKGSEDPLDLSSFKETSDTFRAGIGNKRRAFVFNAFNIFFKGMDDKINWILAKDFM